MYKDKKVGQGSRIEVHIYELLMFQDTQKIHMKLEFIRIHGMVKSKSGVNICKFT